MKPPSLLVFEIKTCYSTKNYTTFIEKSTISALNSNLNATLSISSVKAFEALLEASEAF